MLTRFLLSLSVLAMLVPAASAQVVLSEFSFRSPASQGSTFFGEEVESVADLNGDGVRDILIGAFREDGSVGRVHVISGADGTAIRSILSPIQNEAAFFGVATAEIGDVDGDGASDFAAASYPTIGGLAVAGRVYLLSGATGVVLRAFESPNRQVNGFFGFNVAGPGDLNGDGTPDVVVGAPDEEVQVGSAMVENQGRAYAFSGADGALLWTSTPEDAEPNGFYGRVVAAGDITGDGTPDLWTSAVGALDSNDLNTGLAYLVDGTNGQIVYEMESGNAAGNANGFFGYSLGALPDITGDGVPDLAVGAPFEGVGGTSVRDGTVSFFSGADGTRLGTYAEDERQAERGYGWEVHPIGDLTGDGVTEIAISAPRQYNAFEARPPPFTEPFSGAVFVVQGSDIGGDAPDLAEVYPSLPTIPTNFAWRFGEDLEPLGDVTGDGLPDFAVSAPTQGANIGFVAVMSGAAVLSVSNEGVNAEDEQVVASSGPVNFPATAIEIIFDVVGLRENDEPQQSEQKASEGGVTWRVRRYAVGPNDLEGISEDNVSAYRWVLTKDGPARLGAGSEIRFRLDEIPSSGITDPTDVTVYFRDSVGSGAFEALTTSYDAAEDELVATGFRGPGEFVFASDGNPLPSEGNPDSPVALTLAPNPVRGVGAVRLTLPTTETVRIGVRDLLGREVARIHDGPLAAGTQTVPLEASALAPGVYLVRAEWEGGAASTRLTVIR
ncbi:MAG: FG-GAP-like repeat-containing protein [Bacteroidota bacterium]